MSSERKPYGLLALRETLIVAESTRRSMQGNRSTDTRPEILLRQALWSAGLRGYRKNVRKLPGTPDLAFGKAKLAIFVHGCFWHGCPTCTRNRTPKTNAAYWAAKLKGNRERDETNQGRLRDLGYECRVVWECELKANNVESVVARIGARLGRS